MTAGRQPAGRPVGDSSNGASSVRSGLGGAWPLDGLEVAYGMPIGRQPVAPLPARHRDHRPSAALRSVLADALRRPPCLISFSGGRDSSLLLAAAVDVARRDGLPLPVPATLVFGDPRTEERQWQELVVARLRLADWERIEVAGDLLDALGPVATGLLARHGLLWPFNTHFHQPIVARAAGGTVVTGFGGDELGLCADTAHAEWVLAGRRPVRRRDLLIVGMAGAPPALRRIVHRRRQHAELARLPWLSAVARRSLAARLGDEAAAMPLGWDRALRRALWPDRYLWVCRQSFAAMAADHDVTMVHPLVAARVVDALATAGGFAGFGSRRALLEVLASGNLPTELLERRSKATFDAPLWTATARQFAARWDGEGVDPALVDVGALRRHWRTGHPHILSTTLLQQAWLATVQPAAPGCSAAGQPVEQPALGVGEPVPPSRPGKGPRGVLDQLQEAVGDDRRGEQRPVRQQHLQSLGGRQGQELWSRRPAEHDPATERCLGAGQRKIDPPAGPPADGADRPTDPEVLGRAAPQVEAPRSSEHVAGLDDGQVVGHHRHAGQVQTAEQRALAHLTPPEDHPGASSHDDHPAVEGRAAEPVAGHHRRRRQVRVDQRHRAGRTAGDETALRSSSVEHRPAAVGGAQARHLRSQLLVAVLVGTTGQGRPAELPARPGGRFRQRLQCPGPCHRVDIQTGQRQAVGTDPIRPWPSGRPGPFGAVAADASGARRRRPSGAMAARGVGSCGHALPARPHRRASLPAGRRTGAVGRHGTHGN